MCVCVNGAWRGCVGRQHLLVHTARSEGYSKLMLGDHCTRLAVKLLTSISLGRGAQLAQDTVSCGPPRHLLLPQDADAALFVPTGLLRLQVW